jgi:hypothetical protein
MGRRKNGYLLYIAFMVILLLILIRLYKPIEPFEDSPETVHNDSTSPITVFLYNQIDGHLDFYKKIKLNGNIIIVVRQLTS